MGKKEGSPRVRAGSETWGIGRPQAAATLARTTSARSQPERASEPIDFSIHRVRRRSPAPPGTATRGRARRPAGRGGSDRGREGRGRCRRAGRPPAARVVAALASGALARVEGATPRGSTRTRRSRRDTLDWRSGCSAFPGPGFSQARTMPASAGARGRGRWTGRRRRAPPARDLNGRAMGGNTSRQGGSGDATVSAGCHQVRIAEAEILAAGPLDARMPRRVSPRAGSILVKR